jgi:hypothetical protein
MAAHTLTRLRDRITGLLRPDPVTYYPDPTRPSVAETLVRLHDPAGWPADPACVVDPVGLTGHRCRNRDGAPIREGQACWHSARMQAIRYDNPWNDRRDRHAPRMVAAGHPRFAMFERATDDGQSRRGTRTRAVMCRVCFTRWTIAENAVCDRCHNQPEGMAA